MKRVRALQVCFVGSSRRSIGDEFDVDDDTALRTGKMPPVMELVDAPPAPAPAPVRKQPKRAAAVTVTEAPAED